MKTPSGKTNLRVIPPFHDFRSYLFLQSSNTSIRIMYLVQASQEIWTEACAELANEAFSVQIANKGLKEVQKFNKCLRGATAAWSITRFNDNSNNPWSGKRTNLVHLVSRSRPPQNKENTVNPNFTRPRNCQKSQNCPLPLQSGDFEILDYFQVCIHEI